LKGQRLLAVGKFQSILSFPSMTESKLVKPLSGTTFQKEKSTCKSCPRVVRVTEAIFALGG
jgi:hypothetical protein